MLIDHAGDVRLARSAALVAGVLLGTLSIVIKAGILAATGGDPGYITLFGAVVAASWIGGVTGGLVATAVTTILDYDIFGFEDGIAFGPDAVTKLVLYIAVSLGVVLLIGSRRASRDRLADALKDAADLAAQIEERDQRLEIMLSASGTGFWDWDMVSGELTWSTAIFQQHGLDPTGPAPDFERYLEIIHPADRDAFASGLAAAIAGSAPFDSEFRIVWPDGSIRWTHGMARVIRDADGAPTRMLGTGQDITEQRRLEDERAELEAEERRADQFRDAFIDVVSHELRTPITTILGITQILARPTRRSRAGDRALLDDVRAESERLYRLVEDLLVLSRVENDRLVVDAEPLEPRRVLQRVVRAEAAELPSIDVTLDVAGDLPIVGGEATYVEQIVRNLLGNAAKYTPRGTKVIVSARREGPDEIAIRVVDDGPGIPEDATERIFGLYYRDPGSTRSVSGSGIGLFVCASLVKAMGGRIWALRRPEGGSEFGFTLRVIEPDEGDDAPIADGRPDPMRSGPTPAPEAER